MNNIPDKQVSRADVPPLGSDEKVFPQVSLFALSHSLCLGGPMAHSQLLLVLQPHFALKGAFQIKAKLVFCFSCAPSG